jgi:site-specific recombinase
MPHPTWDLPALLSAADARAPRPERHLWLVRLMQWLRHGLPSTTPSGETPLPVLRLRHLLIVLERNPEPRTQVVALLARFWRETDLATLFADLGFTSRRDLWGEVGARLRLRCLPRSPDTDDLAELFPLLFTGEQDEQWLRDIDTDTLTRLATLLAEARSGDWREPLLQAVTWLVSAVRAEGFTPLLRQRMSPELLADQPYTQLVRCGEALAESLRTGDHASSLQQAAYLRAVLQCCRTAADSVGLHLEEHGISVHIVFALEQLQGRIARLESVLDVLLSPTPERELRALLADLVALGRQRRSLRALLARHHALLARKVAERHADAGEAYITRNAAEYRQMLARAAGGGAVVGLTTFAKFGILALGFAPFWGGLGTGLAYAASFLVIQWAHWTLATKQPAMTAPAMAARLKDLRRHGSTEAFADEVMHLVRSQMAGIAGNLAVVVPVVLALQGLAWWALGQPLVSEHDAEHVLQALTLQGPTALFAAFTGVLLFASSLIAGWVENWFVYHRLESALTHHLGLMHRLGAARTARWAAWWRHNISGVAANVSLGLMLGLLPPLLAFMGLPLEARHVTLSTGQLAAAVGTLGWGVLLSSGFWWCVAGIVATGALNLGVSFWLALQLALRARGIAATDQRSLRQAVWQKFRARPLAFVLPR